MHTQHYKHAQSFHHLLSEKHLCILCVQLYACLPTFVFTNSAATMLQIVVINAVDPDNLPPLAPAPAVTTSPGEKKQRQNLAPKPKDPVADSPKPKARATLEPDGPDFIADKKEVQPPVAESIKLASGISLRAGTAVQSGPKRIVDLDHMTKRDHAKYLAKAAAENAVTLTGAKGTKGSKLPSESLANGRLQSQGSLGAKVASAAHVSSPAVQPLKQRMQQQQQQPQAAVTTSSIAMLTQVSDGEELKWARDGVPKKIAAKTVDRPPSPVDPNLALLSDSSWGLTAAVKGRSPAQLPAKEAVAAGKCCCAQCFCYFCMQFTLTCGLIACIHHL